MIDTKELRRLVQAALAAPDGLSAEWMDRLGQFQEAADPAAVSELLDRLEDAESDGLEQARLNGMGASREAALMAKLAATETAWKVSEKSCHDLTEKVIPNLQDQLEAAEMERDNYKVAYKECIEKTEWVQRGINDGTIPPKYLGWHRADVVADLLSAAEKERDTLRAAMEKIADWYGAWGPYPETNKSWCAMAIVTAREAVKPLTNLCAKGEEK